MTESNATTKSSITVGDKTIETEIRLLQVAKLRYYAENPRIHSILKQLGDSVTQEQIEHKLWDLESTKDLYQDIKRNGGLLEEIIVQGDEVLEGNSRLCAYRHLLKNAIEKKDAKAIERWSHIRAKLLPEGISDELIFGILGILHIRGKAEWKPYEQASYLYRQKITYGKRERDLADQIGIKETEVKNMIEAYTLMEKYSVTDPSRFSYYVEFAKSRKLSDLSEKKEYFPPNFALEERFSEWVREDKIPRAEAVRDDLPDILKDKSARTKFLSGNAGFEEALEIVRGRHPETTSSFYSKLKRAEEAMSNAEVLTIKGEISQDSQKRYVIVELYRTARKFARDVGIDIQNAEREKRPKEK